MEQMGEMGFCNGIENYSRHLSGRRPGEAPPTLIDYFPKDFLLVLDESHQTIPQVGAMYRGDRARKETLVEYGFRLPSALDNRPLKFDEFEAHITNAIHVSATPGDWEMEKAEGVFVEQVIRPTGLLDPIVEVRPVAGQVDDLLIEIRKRVAANERVLCTTLTKRMSEDLTDYYRELGVRIKYLHSDIDTLERMEILRDLRLGEFDVLVGINLLREGLDLPEVSLVAIFDADKEGFLRSPRSLIQTIGRAARNSNGRVFLYGDRITAAMRHAMDETDRRRAIQIAYNAEHGITPTTVVRAVTNMHPGSGTGDYVDVPVPRRVVAGEEPSVDDLAEDIVRLRKEMFLAAEALDFEKAARLRDEIKRTEARLRGEGGDVPDAAPERASFDPYAKKAGKTAKKSASSKGKGAPSLGTPLVGATPPRPGAAAKRRKNPL